jgi:hypothetical protein
VAECVVGARLAFAITAQQFVAVWTITGESLVVIFHALPTDRVSTIGAIHGERIPIGVNIERCSVVPSALTDQTQVSIVVLANGFPTRASVLKAGHAVASPV